MALKAYLQLPPFRAEHLMKDLFHCTFRSLESCKFTFVNQRNAESIKASCKHGGDLTRVDKALF